MKITPAHSVEANDMAQCLLEQWTHSHMPINCSIDAYDDKPTLPVVQERLALAFGWDSWQAMLSFISQPHEAFYLDNDESALQSVVLKLSNSIGFNYPHGAVYNLIQNAGVGYSPAMRRDLKLNASPWGQIIERNEIAQGIVVVSTASHGGIMLSQERSEAIPPHLSLNQLAYEEDSEAKFVQLAFPQYFREALKYNLASIGLYASRSIPEIIDPKLQSLLGDSNHRISSLYGEQPKPDPSLNRELTQQETEAIDYLSQCVLRNVKPIVVPESDCPTLQDWVAVFSTALRVDNAIPFTSMVWKKHFLLA
ncbi:DUF7007 domain-containing protein [Photobacterium leiognathi]|uniref:DUF7007 domain-containing protein n=1 Tax=Photobacterium leiognathi TaxID=553611 RepID=UPI00298187D8|nr:hypothetical protein [Photobacterium leiognathi]